MDSQTKENRNGGRTSKRNRDLLSCTECHRRKQKCNRLLPCNDCTLRGVPQKCAYKPPVSNQDSSNAGRAGKNSRLKRIISGAEVLLTPESVQALQNFPDATSDVDVISDEMILHNNMDLSFMPNEPFPAPTIFYPTYTEVHSLNDATSSVNFWFLGGLDPFSATPNIPGSPIPKDWLISHFIRVLAPWLSSYDDSLTAISPRVSWFSHSLNHMPLFYATMLSAAVHLDNMRPFGDISKLLWYKAETLRLTNEALGTPEGASDQMILVALILLYFNVTGNNIKEYEIHLHGIHQMLNVRGGVDNTGMNGMVKNWIDVCYGPWDKGWKYDEFKS